MPDTVSDAEFLLLTLTVPAVGMWIWDTVSATRDIRAALTGDVREVALYMLSMRVVFTLFEVTLLLAVMIAALTPDSSARSPLSYLFLSLSVAIQMGALLGALWGRSLRRRLGRQRG